MPSITSVTQPFKREAPEIEGGFKAATSRPTGDEFSPILAWAREQDQKGDLVKTSEGKEHMKAHVAVLTTMLQSVSSNPLQDNGVEGIRVLQALVEGIARVKQEEKMDVMADLMKQGNFLQSASLVGKKGEFSSRTFSVGPDSSDEVFYEVPKGSKPQEVRVSLSNAQGLKIAELLGPTEEGRHSLGTLLSRLDPGEYGFHVWGIDADEELIEIRPIVSSEVKSIKQEGSDLLVFSGKNFQPLKSLLGVSIVPPRYLGGD
jgi:flagellar hook assembly protein FlgD